MSQCSALSSQWKIFTNLNAERCEGEEVSVRECGLLGLYSKRLFDHLDFFVVWKAAMWQTLIMLVWLRWGGNC